MFVFSLSLGATLTHCPTYGKDEILWVNIYGVARQST